MSRQLTAKPPPTRTSQPIWLCAHCHKTVDSGRGWVGIHNDHITAIRWEEASGTWQAAHWTCEPDTHYWSIPTHRLTGHRQLRVQTAFIQTRDWYPGTNWIQFITTAHGWAAR